MSSILKALQKLERDKETRNTKEPDITSAIKMSSQKSKQQPLWIVPVMLIAVAVASISVTFSLMGGFSQIKKVKTPVSKLPDKVETPQVHNQKKYDALQSIEPAAAPLNLTPSKPLTGAVVKTRRLNPPDADSTKLHSIPTLPVTGQQTSPEPTPAPQTDETSPQRTIATQKIKISGIAWQKDSASRIAVVNGRSVSEGSVVDEAKVEQIFPDRVKFSRNGKLFEVFLNHESDLN